MNEIDIIAALDSVPENSCRLFASLTRQQMYYFDSFHESPYADEAALLRFRHNLQEEYIPQGLHDFGNSILPFATITNDPSLHWRQLMKLLLSPTRTPCTWLIKAFWDLQVLNRRRSR